MIKVTTTKIYQLLLDIQEQMQAGFHGARIELKTEIQRLELRMERFETRMDGFDKQLTAMRETQQEDSQALNSVVMGHEKRLTRLEKWRVKTAAV